VDQRKEQGPVKVEDQLPKGTRIKDFNAWLAIKITKGVGTMWCAYAFAVFDVLALPTAVRGGLYGIVQWVASFFLQLVLLSIIMVGQDGQAKAMNKRNDQSFCDVEAILHEQGEQGKHLAAQDAKILEILAAVRSEGGGSGVVAGSVGGEASGTAEAGL